MALTHLNVTQSSQSLPVLKTESKTSITVQRSSVKFDPTRVVKAASPLMPQESQSSVLATASTYASPQEPSKEDVAVQSARLAAMMAAEKSDADAEKQLLLAKEEQEIQDLQLECKLQLTKHALQPRLSSVSRAQSRSTLMSYLERLETCLKNFKQVDSTSKKVREVALLIQAVTASVNQFHDFENRVDSVLKEINSITAKISANQFSSDEAAALSVRYRQMMSGEESRDTLSLTAVVSCAESPEVQVAINAVLGLFKQMELKADNEAVAFVEAGSSLCKYTRDKVIKKSKHDPVSSTVKIASGVSLLWGSHTNGPQILELSLGPSQVLLDSGLLGHK